MMDEKSGENPKGDAPRKGVRVQVQAGVGTGQPRTALPVTLERTSRPFTEDELLWLMIQKSTENLSFDKYVEFIDGVLCEEGDDTDPTVVSGKKKVSSLNRSLPFPGIDPYRLLKVATEAFVMVNCGIALDDLEPLIKKAKARLGHDPGDRINAEYADDLCMAVLDEYFEEVKVGVGSNRTVKALPYLAIIRSKIPEYPVQPDVKDDDVFRCFGILKRKLSCPCYLELIWSYWHEEGMLAQTMNAVMHRFQNRRGPGDLEPLTNLEIDPLRPLGNLLWGHVQDELHRLSVIRRAHEYEHHYGFTLHGKAVTRVRTAESRSKFIESFHNLLYRCTHFFREDDDTTVIADGFPVLNAVKETHYLLAQGAHNQFGDLPSTARQEMLIEMWLLARPEMRDFLGGRVMVPYPEVWMDRVDAVKALMGWTDVSVVHFHDLAVFGEQLLLAIRYGGWSLINDPEPAANWARFWRPQIQGYMHAYRAATGVDLTADITDQQQAAVRYLAPSVHLRNRLAAQRGR